MARTKVTAGKSSKSTSQAPSQSQSLSQPPSKKVRIAEPSEEETETPLVRKARTGRPKSILSKKGKGKEPAIATSSQPEPTETAHHSDSETESLSPTNLASSSRPKVKEGQIPQAPQNYNVNMVMINSPFKFKDRDLCPAVCIDLDHVSGLLGQDLREYMEHYDNLISLQNPFNPDMVRIFYNNMIEKNVIGNKKKVIEYGLQTIMRGQRINISAELINVYLGTMEFDPSLQELGNGEIFELLKPGETYQEGQRLHFEPSSMPPLQRTIHYIYSRCMVNKGKNYTHLSSLDYQILGSIMKKERRNIGQMVLNEMLKLVRSKSTKMTLPYPSLVSRILDLHHVWYLFPDQIPLTPQKFSEKHFHRMSIDIGASQPVSTSLRKKKTTSATSRGHDEAQSSAPQQQHHSVPSFTQAALQTFMQTEFRRMGDEFTTAFHAETQSSVHNLFQSSLDAAVATMLQSFDSLRVHVSSEIASLSHSVQSLDSRVGSLETYIRGTQTPPSAPPPPGSDPSSSEQLFAQIDFSAAAQPPTDTPHDLPPSSPPHPL